MAVISALLPDESSARWRRVLWLGLRIVGQFLLFMACFQAYKMVRRSFIQRAEGVAYHHALDILRWEDRLGIDIELRLQRWVIDHDWLFAFFNRYYMAFMWMFYSCALTALLLAPARYPYFRRVFLCSMLLALPWFYFYPLAPPRFMGPYGYPFIDSQAVYGPHYFEGRAAVQANQFAAMPSMHCGWTFIGAVMLAYALPWKRIGVWIGAVYFLLMSLTVMVTGHHYILDIAGGLVTAGAAFLLAWWLPRWWVWVRSWGLGVRTREARRREGEEARI